MGPLLMGDFSLKTERARGKAEQQLKERRGEERRGC